MYYCPNRVLGLRIFVLSHKTQNTWSTDSQMQIMRHARFWSLPISPGNSRYILWLIKSLLSYSCYKTEILLRPISANITVEFEMIVYINVEYWKERECQHSCWLFGKLLYDNHLLESCLFFNILSYIVLF